MMSVMGMFRHLTERRLASNAFCSYVLKMQDVGEAAYDFLYKDR
jgi:hypothetical protein